MTYSLTTGRAAGAAVPEHFLSGTNWLDGIRKWAMAGVSVMPSLALGFTTDTYVMDGEYAPNFVELASHSRASKAWEPNWDGKSGSEVGWLKEYPVDERRVGIYGSRDEAASTNQIRNPRFEGAALGVVGSGGALPANLTMPAFGGQVEVLATGTVNGWPRLRLRVSGTPTSFPRFFLEDTTAVSVSQGQTWTGSLGMALVGGSWSNVSPRIRMLEYTSAAGYIAEWAEDIDVDDTHRRYSQTHTVVNSNAAYSRFDFYMYWTSGAVDFTFDLFLPQLEQSATPTSPILPTVGTPAAATRAADVVTGVTTDRASRGWYDTQWDYTNGGKCGDLLEFLPGVPRVGPKGLLVEEGTTNETRNPRCEGAVAGVLGSGGSLPTHWTFFKNTGVTVTVDGSGTDAEGEYLQLSFSGTGDGQVCEVRYEGLAQTAAASGETWTVSHGFKVTAGDDTGVSTLRQRIVSWSGFSVVEQFSSGESLPSGNAVERRFYTATLSTACDYVTGGFRVDFAASGTVSFTIRVYIPQMEEKSYPTSVVLPEAGSPATATRDADLPLLPLSGAAASSGSPFSISAEVETALELGAYNYQMILSVGDDNSNYFGVFMDAATQGELRMTVKEGGTNNVAENVSGSAVSGAGNIVRFAARVAENDFHAVAGGAISGSVTDTTTVTSYSDQKIWLGVRPDAGKHFNGFIRSVRYTPAGLSNSELEALVA